MKKLLSRIFNNHKLSTNFAFVLVSQILVFVSGVLATLFIPKIFSVVNYGYIKTFTLYFAYAGLAHIGFCDGIHLMFAGKNIEELDKSKFRVYTKFFLIFEAIVSAISIGVFLIIFRGSSAIVFVLLGVSVLVYNIYSYYLQLATITSKFKLVSIANLCEAGFKFLTILCLMLVSKFVASESIHFSIYIILYVLAFAIAAGIMFVSFRNLTFGKTECSSDYKTEIIALFKLGIPLLLCNFLVSYVTSLPAMITQWLYPVEESAAYATYSFASAISSIITPIIVALSLVIFPTIKKMSTEEALKHYPKMSTLVVVSCCLSFVLLPLLVFAMKIVGNKYEGSVDILRIIFPSIIRCLILCVILNYYKLLNKTWMFTIISASCVILVGSACFIAYFGFLKNAEYMVVLRTFAMISTIGCYVWLISTLIGLRVIAKVQVWKDIAYVICCCALYFAIVFFFHLNDFGFVVLYLLTFVTFTVAFKYEDFMPFFKSFQKLILKIRNKIEK